MNDDRAQIEQEIQETMAATLNEEKLNGGKVQTVDIPYDFKGMVNVKAK